MCVFIVLMQGEEESLSGQRLFKDHSWIIAEISLGIRRPKLIVSNSPYITTCCSNGFQEKNWLIQKQTPAFVRHNWNFQ